MTTTRTRPDLGDLLDVPLEVLLDEAVPDADLGAPVALETVDYPSGSPATASLHRLRGTTRGGAPWSLFVKGLQHVRHWPGLAMLPPQLAASFADELPWRAELHLWSATTRATMPAGVRAPVLHRLVERPDDRAAVWMEDVAHRTPHDLDAYARAARLLGRWNARSTSEEVLAATGHAPGHGLRMYAERSVPLRGLAPLEDDGLWAHPWLAHHADLRARLRALGREVPAMLDRLDRLPQCVPHGDASPQNLLTPTDPDHPAHRAGDGPGLVAIDASFCTPHALGFDLGQLWLGLTHAGEVPADRLPEIAVTIEPAYLAGLADEGLTEEAQPGVSDVVRDGFATSVLLRSGFDSFLLHLLGAAGTPDEPEARHAFDERLALADVVSRRYLATRS